MLVKKYLKQTLSLTEEDHMLLPAVPPQKKTHTHTTKKSSICYQRKSKKVVFLETNVLFKLESVIPVFVQ